MKRNVHGVFCLETDWWGDFNRASTVKPVLDLLGSGDAISVPSVHRDVGTREEFDFYCRRWQQKGTQRYPILYLAFHGGPGCLYIGDGRRTESTVHLDELAELLGTGLKNRLVHFASCETLRTDRRNLQRFLQTTGAVAVSGYRLPIDWLESATFEVLFFDSLLRYSLTPAGMRRARARFERDYRSLGKKLDFRMEVREGSRRTG